MLTICDHPIISSRLNQMRDLNCPSALFRQCLDDVAIFLTYEAARDLDVIEVDVRTPLETMKSRDLKHKAPALISILRAGNGLLNGALQVFPEAKVGFLGMYRDEETLRPVDYYSNIPKDLGDAPVLLLDPMLATGHSALHAIDFLKVHLKNEIRLLTLVSAPEGVKTIEEKYADLPIFTAALDRELNSKGYILPGLGDAGDRIYNS